MGAASLRAPRGVARLVTGTAATPRAPPPGATPAKPKDRSKQSNPGQLEMHPHHGPSTVTALRDRAVKGASMRYPELRVHRSDLTIALPEEKAAEVGVRQV